MAVALLIMATIALADPVVRGARIHKARAPAASAQTTDDGYYVPYVIGVDGKKYPIMETPGSVTVIPRQPIDDQQATTLGDAMRNVSDVAVIHR
ncbi:MAG: Plug domain-containing protein [Alphaproteobacteria bacterium]|nr:Plug domain-containing protein [Alphaproteobacteria bacterium]MBM3653123.1 Plug domain-containing protein [Alphaproteobacteria bacterium]